MTYKLQSIFGFCFSRGISFLMIISTAAGLYAHSAGSKTGREIAVAKSAAGQSPKIQPAGRQSSSRRTFAAMDELYCTEDVITVQTKTTAADRATGDHFGISVAVFGNKAVVGASHAKIGSNQFQGAAYVFNFNGSTWVQEAKLVAPDGAANDYFGYSVDINGEFVIVGAFQDDIGAKVDQGSVYVYRYNGGGWNYPTKLVAADGEADDQFGRSVAVDGRTFAIGAPYDDYQLVYDKGSVYAFVFNPPLGYYQQGKFSPSDVASADRFGTSVDVRGNSIIAGAPGDDVGVNTDQGSISIFTRYQDNWSQFRKLTAPDGAAGDFFGEKVDGGSEAGAAMIVGAPFADINGKQDQGAAYAYYNAVSPFPPNAPTKLVAPCGRADDRFGSSVGVSSENFVVGAFLADIGTNSDQGAIYTFELFGDPLNKIIAADGAAGDYFGYALGAEELRFIIGSPHDSTAGQSWHGAAYIY